MPTLPKPAQVIPRHFAPVSFKEIDKILELLGHEKSTSEVKTDIIAELETYLQIQKNNLIIINTWPLPSNVKASLVPIEKAAMNLESFISESNLNDQVWNVMRHKGRFQIDYSDFRKNLSELKFQAQQAIKEMQKAGKGSGGDINKRLQNAREHAKLCLEKLIYEKYLKNNDSKKRRKDFWKICKLFIEPTAEK
jgi:hypothetical protein